MKDLLNPFFREVFPLEGIAKLGFVDFRGSFAPIFDSFSGDNIRNVGIIPRKRAKNQRKKTRKSTNPSFAIPSLSYTQFKIGYTSEGAIENTVLSPLLLALVPWILISNSLDILRRMFHERSMHRACEVFHRQSALMEDH
jgi:hypothetical protein